MASPVVEKWIPQGLQTYYRTTRSHFFGLVVILLLLVIYEAGSARLYAQNLLAVKNSAELMIKRVLWIIGMRQDWMQWLVYFLFLGSAFWFARKQKEVSIRFAYFPYAIFESLVYALFFGTVVTLLTKTVSVRFLGDEATAAGLAAKMVLALGAGVYEELAFRLILITALLFVFQRLIPGKAFIRTAIAIVISAALFSAFHYMGVSEKFSSDSFLFRFYAGVILGTIFVLRGIGIAAYTHAFYDLFLILHG